jgi:hypothetical protein
LLAVDGSPLARAFVNIRAKDFSQFKNANTDDMGRFEISLEPGDYVIDGYGVNEKSKTGDTYFWKYVQLGKEFSVDATPGVKDLGQIRKKAPNFVVSFFDANNKVFSNAEVMLTKSGESSGTGDRFTTTDAFGRAEFALTDGNYTLQWIKANGQFISLYGLAEVKVESDLVTTVKKFVKNTKGEYSFRLKPTHRGKLMKFAGQDVRIFAASDEQCMTDPCAPPKYFFESQLKADGTFELMVPEAGNYRLQNYTIMKSDFTQETVHIDRRFTVTADELQQAETKPIDLGEVGANVTGTLKYKGQLLDRASMEFRPSNLTESQRKMPWLYNRYLFVQANGVINGFLPTKDANGNALSYELVAVHSDRFIQLKGLNYSFVGKDSLTINLDIHLNTSGQVKDQNGKALSNAWIEVWKVDQAGNQLESLGMSTDQSGQFETNLEDGNYLIRNVHYNVNGEYRMLSVYYAFKVEQGISELDQHILQPNVFAKLRRADGSAFANGEMTLRRQGVRDDEWSKHQWVRADQMGNVAMLLNSGAWQIRDMHSDQFWSRLDLSFDVSDSGNVTGAKVVKQSGVWVIAPPQPNLKGTIVDQAGQAISRAWISIRRADATDTDYHLMRWISANEQGKFEFVLEPSVEDYVITGMGGKDLYYALNLRFHVNDDQIASITPKTPALQLDVNANMTIRPPLMNVKGVVKNEYAELISNGWIMIKPFGARENDYTNAVWTETDAQAKFKVNLRIGKYTVVNGGNATQWLPLNYTFEVVNENATLNLAVQPPAPNVIGTLYNGKASDASPQTFADGWVTLLRVNQNDQVLDADDAVVSIDWTTRNEIWKYTLYYRTDATGTFKANLKPGKYMVYSAGAPGIYMESYKMFEVKASQTTALDIYRPENNFTGTIANLKQAALDQDNSGYYLIVKDQNDANRMWWVPVVKTTTSGVGGFDLQLSPGSYEVESYFSPEGEVSIDPIQFTLSKPGQKHQVAIVPVTAIVAKLKLAHVDSNIRATVKVKETTSSGEKFVLIQTDVAGNFAIVMKDQVTYQVLSVITDDFYAVTNSGGIELTSASNVNDLITVQY